MRILIVEDEHDILTFLKTSLEAECFAVDAVADGERGSYLALTSEYDLIILDNLLPKKTGREICEALRAAGKTTPIIMLSVKAEASTKVDLLNAGADDYLTKPFSLQELVARVRALLRRPHRIEGEVLKMGDISMNTRSQTLTRKGKDIYLTRKEFMLLEYLMRNRGTVLSRGMILEHVWDMSADPFSNTIESHILSLRKKIDTEKSKIIKTVPGRGYKIDERV